MDFLLHCCCGPCAAGCLGALRAAGLRPGLYFSNSNLDTEAEYERRLAAARTLAAHDGVELVVDAYDHAAWLESGTAALAAEPEGGRRCTRCFAFSLARTAACAAELGIAAFATSLTVSPYKNHEQIFAAGRRFSGFRPWNFRRDGDYRAGCRLARELGLYRQRYCGCEFSLNHSVTKVES